MLHSTSLRRSHGYTLVELLVVMAILAALSLVAVPWFLKISQRNIVKSAAREVATTLQAARMRAVKRNLQVQVLITTPTGPRQFNRFETFELASPTIKVGELDLPPTIGIVPLPGNQVIFGGDGRATTFGRTDVQGPVGAGVTNVINVQVFNNGRVAVVTPNPWK